MQALTLLLAGVMMLRIAPMPAGQSAGTAVSPLKGIAKVCERPIVSVIFDALLINFVSASSTRDLL